MVCEWFVNGQQDLVEVGLNVMDDALLVAVTGSHSDLLQVSRPETPNLAPMCPPSRPKSEARRDSRGDTRDRCWNRGGHVCVPVLCESYTHEYRIVRIDAHLCIYMYIHAHM